MKKYLSFIFLSLFIFSVYSDGKKELINLEGKWKSKYYYEWENEHGILNEDRNILSIIYPNKSEKGILSYSGTSPWEIKVITQDENKLTFECYRMIPDYNENTDKFSYVGIVDEKETIIIDVLDENNILIKELGNISFLRPTQFIKIGKK